MENGNRATSSDTTPRTNHLLSNVAAFKLLGNTLLAERVLRSSQHPRSHIQITANSPPLYEYRKTLWPFFWDLPSTIPKSLLQYEGASGKDGDQSPRKIFLFGIGFGEQLNFLLDHFEEDIDDVQIIAWDRDPQLLNHTISCTDYSHLLLHPARVLRFVLGIDVLHVLPEVISVTRVDITSFLSLYWNDN